MCGRGCGAGECKSKSEEDAIMIREMESLKTRFADSKVDKTKLKELLLRLLYVDMLGHDASFAYIHAVKMCNEPSLVLKKVRSQNRRSERNLWILKATGTLLDSPMNAFMRFLPTVDTFCWSGQQVSEYPGQNGTL